MKVEVIKEGVIDWIDWSKPQLVIGNLDVIVMITEDQSKAKFGEFSGIDISNGRYLNDWIKSAFKPFTGVVTIKND